MALARDLSESQLAFQIKGGDADQFHVMQYRGTEGLSQLFRFEMDLVASDPDIELNKLVRTPAKLTIRGNDGERFFHGIISRFEFVDETVERAYYRAELVPLLWLLTHRYNNRIYQNKKVGEIITSVLDVAGIPTDRMKQTLSRTSPTREYCVQYRETDFNFICRLMEEEGIWWYFEHDEEDHTFVLADDKSAYQPLQGGEDLAYRPPSGLNVETDHVFRFRKGEAVRPGTTVLNDYNFTNPKLKLESKHDLARDAGLEFYDFPGEYASQLDGNDYAKLRAEEFETGRVLALGMSNCARLMPGRTFNLTEHPSRNCNGSYLLTKVMYQGKQATTHSTTGGNGRTSFVDSRVHQALIAAQQHDNMTIRELATGLLQLISKLRVGDATNHRERAQWVFHAGQVCGNLASLAQIAGLSPLDALSLPNLLGDVPDDSLLDHDAPAYECRFECIPSDVSYRPPRVSPWPVMRGAQTARVVGPKGEEIHTDEYGRVKVHFHWDREGKYEDTDSCWVRVSHSMAGGQYGMMFLPRVGQEVLVDFLEGNPDDPVIVGRLFNADNMPPYPLPSEKSRSGIKTHSTKGGGGTNEIRFEDLKDGEQILIRGQKDLHLRVMHQERHNVAENQYLTVGGEQRTKVGGHRSVDVVGQDALHVAGTRSVVVDGDVLEDFKKNHGQKVASQYYIKANQFVVEATSGISLKVGGNFVVIDSSGVTINGAMTKINSGGSALSPSVTISPASPASPEDADDVTPGQDASYGGEPKPPPKIEEKPYQGHWVSIDLKNETDGKPCAGEYYEVTTPSGKILSGALDVNGYARVWVSEPGNCQITFPKREGSEWKRG